MHYLRDQLVTNWLRHLITEPHRSNSEKVEAPRANMRVSRACETVRDSHPAGIWCPFRCMARQQIHNTTNDYVRLDVRWLQRKGYLRPGWSGTVNWSRCGERFAFYQYLCFAREIDAAIQNPARGWRIAEQSIPSSWNGWTIFGLEATQEHA